MPLRSWRERQQLPIGGRERVGFDQFHPQRVMETRDSVGLLHSSGATFHSRFRDVAALGKSRFLESIKDAGIQ